MLEVNVEPVGEEEGFAFGQMRFDFIFVRVRLYSVGRRI